MPYSSFNLFDQNKSILVFGRDGQLGKAFQQCLKNLQLPVIFLGRSDCELSDEAALHDVFSRYQPQVIINAAAYTAVEQAESEPELAFSVNARAPELMAQYIAKTSQGVLVHFSSDYVFGDTKQEPYFESDSTGPANQLNVYGQSKMAGEKVIEAVFNSTQGANYKYQSASFYILRTSWVYGDGDNFIRKILRLARDKNHLQIIADQIGAPTFASWLANISIQIAMTRVESGIYHVVPDGQTSWHGLALFAVEVAAAIDKSVKVKPENIIQISSQDNQSIAKRPHNSQLNNAKLKEVLSKISIIQDYPHWQNQVEEYVRDYVKSL